MELEQNKQTHWPERIFINAPIHHPQFLLHITGIQGLHYPENQEVNLLLHGYNF